MGDDLISRKAVLDKLALFNDREHGNEHFFFGLETAKEIIENEPTAFDKEKVFEELKEVGQECNECNDTCGVEAIEYAMEIVKKGGIE